MQHGIVAAAAVVGLAAGAAEAQDAAAYARQEILATADAICGELRLRGEASAGEGSGKVGAELSGLFSRLADVGVSVEGGFDLDAYENVLREDLAGELQDIRKCRLKIWDDLRPVLVPAATRSGREATGSPRQFSYVRDLSPPDEWLALRTEPTTAAGARILKMPEGTRLTPLDRSGDWLRVQLIDDTVGWAHGAYIDCCIYE